MVPRQRSRIFTLAIATLLLILGLASLGATGDQGDNQGAYAVESVQVENQTVRFEFNDFVGSGAHGFEIRLKTSGPAIWDYKYSTYCTRGAIVSHPTQWLTWIEGEEPVVIAGATTGGLFDIKAKAGGVGVDIGETIYHSGAANEVFPRGNAFYRIFGPASSDGPVEMRHIFMNGPCLLKENTNVWFEVTGPVEAVEFRVMNTTMKFLHEFNLDLYASNKASVVAKNGYREIEATGRTFVSSSLISPVAGTCAVPPVMTLVNNGNIVKQSGLDFTPTLDELEPGSIRIEVPEMVCTESHWPIFFLADLDGQLVQPVAP